MTKPAYLDLILKQSEQNHIWLNAFACIRPTDDFLIELGRKVLDMLNEKDRLIPSSGITSDIEAMREISKLSPQLILRVNKS